MPAKNRERREAIERAADEVAAFDVEALDEGAEHHALGESRQAGACGKTVIPERAMLGVAIAEFERQPAKDQGQQHQQDREIDRRNDDGEGDREGGEQADAAENEPGLVAVPDRRDRVHHQIARIAVGREVVEHADAEIETVERDIEEDADGEDGGPDRHQVERCVMASAPRLPAPGPRPAISAGR